MARRRKRDAQDEPFPPEDGWIQWGAEAIWAVGETPGGAPYGPTEGDLREAAERENPSAGWALAKAILRRAVQRRMGSRAAVEVGYVKRLGKGLSRDIFAAQVDVSPDPDNLSGPYAVLLPRPDAIPGLDPRTRREGELLERLAGLVLPFRVPRVLAAVLDGSHWILVRQFFDGIEMDFRAGHQSRVRPWEVVGRLAAAIHRIDLAGFADLLPGYATRRDHGQAALQVFDGLEDSEAREAHTWAREHLPPDAPAVFVHGDLLGQNILLWPEAPPAVIDWEYALRGDPAYDLAIVTGGVRRPFQMDRGLDRLLEAYAAAGGQPMLPADVCFHELCLAAGWYREALAGEGPHPPDQERQRLRAILRRAQAARA